MKASSSTIKYLSPEETKSLFRIINARSMGNHSKRDRALFLVAYCHGLRPSEVGLIQTSDVDLTRGRIMVTRVKNSNSGEHPMQPNEIRAVKAWMKERNPDIPWLFYGPGQLPISRRGLHYLMNVYCEKAGIPQDKRHFHVLRHSIATHFRAAGADIAFIQEWLGHKNIQNTMVYAQITNPARDKQAIKLFASPMVVA